MRQEGGPFRAYDPGPSAKNYTSTATRTPGARREIPEGDPAGGFSVSHAEEVPQVEAALV
jgi:hypothetical protein